MKFEMEKVKKEDGGAIMGFREYCYRVNAKVEAVRIAEIRPGDHGVGHIMRCEDEDGWRPLTKEMTARYFPVVGDYLVRQPDGYEYLNPKDVFEGKFERVENRVTPDRLEEVLGNAKVETMKVGEKTTLLHVTLPNGYTITETSSCVDPANYDHDLGCQICMKRVEEKVWELEGYLLQFRLAK